MTRASARQPETAATTTRDPSFALALGGGGARGLAHIHVIEAFDELGIRPRAIAGSSIGAIMGAGMAAGIGGREIRDHAEAILGHRAAFASRMWRARPGTFGEFVESGGLRMSQFDLGRILNAFLPTAIPQTFGGLEIPLKVTATEFFGARPVVIEEGDLASALAASAAIPALFRPVTRGGDVLIDGGLTNPVPFDLVAGAADIVIAIDVVGTPAEAISLRPRTLDLMFGASQIMMQTIVALKLAQGAPAIFLRPPVSRFRVLDFLKIELVLAETSAFKDEVKRALHAAAEAHMAGRMPQPVPT